MSYTVGNWTVAVQTVDTISSPKSLSIPDLDYPVDYTVTDRNSGEVRLANVTGPGLTPVEQLRFGRTRVADVYSDAGIIPAAMKCNVRDGVRTLCEVRYTLKATNSVNGEELLLPMKGWICLQVPTADFITSAALLDLLKRTIAAAFATGAVDATQITRIAQGDLDPTA
jgi:hypothetical protein